MSADVLAKKAEEINLVLSEPEVDLWKLRELALTEGGLVNDTLRKRAWPRLVGVHDIYTSDTTEPHFIRAAVKNRPPTSPDSPSPSSSSATATPASPTTARSAAAAIAVALSNRTSTGGGGSGLPPRKSSATNASANGNPSKGVPGGGGIPPFPSLGVTGGRELPPRPKSPGNGSNGGGGTRTPSRSSSYERLSELGDEGSVNSSSSQTRRKNRILAECMDAEQIERDTARCTWHLLTGSQRTRRMQMENKHRRKVATLLKRKQARLGNLINLSLLQTYEYAEKPEERLRYYQGFHDVASICLTVLGGAGPTLASATQQQLPPGSPAAAAGGAATPSTSTLHIPLSAENLAASMGLTLPSRVLQQLSHYHFRDALRSNFSELQAALRLSIFPLLAALDPPIHDHLWQCDMEPFFALSWIITWFSHDIRDTNMIKRLFDAFIVSHPIMPIYMTVAMLCHPINRLEILSTECEFALIHQALATLPRNSNAVGWKFRRGAAAGGGVGDGYVSGEDIDDEDGTASTEATANLISPEDIVVVEGRDDEESEATSLVSSAAHSSFGRDTAKVPFQDLIDTAISYMSRIPPKKLLLLAQNYFMEDELTPMMTRVPDITMLKMPPQWGVLAKTPADWVLKQRAREREGRRGSHRRDRRRRRRSGSRNRQEGEQNGGAAGEGGDQQEDIDPDQQQTSEHKKKKRKLIYEDMASTTASSVSTTASEQAIEEYLSREPQVSDKSMAIIACGVSTGDTEEQRRRRKRNKLLLWGGAAVVLITFSVVVIVTYGGGGGGGGSSKSGGAQPTVVVLESSDEKPPKPAASDSRSGDHYDTTSVSSGSNGTSTIASSSPGAEEVSISATGETKMSSSKPTKTVPSDPSPTSTKSKETIRNEATGKQQGVPVTKVLNEGVATEGDNLQRSDFGGTTGRDHEASTASGTIRPTASSTTTTEATRPAQPISTDSSSYELEKESQESAAGVSSSSSSLLVATSQADDENDASASIGNVIPKLYDKLTYRLYLLTRGSLRFMSALLRTHVGSFRPMEGDGEDTTTTASGAPSSRTVTTDALVAAVVSAVGDDDDDGNDGDFGEALATTARKLRRLGVTALKSLLRGARDALADEEAEVVVL